jgi:prolyl 4-hydroxylase
MVFQFDDALEQAICRRLRGIYDRHKAQASAFDYSGFPVLEWHDFAAEPEVSAMLLTLLRQTQQRIIEVLPGFDPIFPETLFLANLEVGGRHPKHADNCEPRAGGWVPNHTPQRDVSALYYLNEDFEGGELVFEQHGLIIKPRTGAMVIFPSDRDHVHEVLPVVAGTRYSVQTWFTRRSEMAMAGV